jgi:hypothetical protein
MSRNPCAPELETGTISSGLREGMRTMALSKNVHEMVQHMDALHQHFLEAALDLGGFLSELQDMAIAVERGPVPTTLEFLLAAGHPMIWLRVTPTTALLLGAMTGHSYRIELDIPLGELQAVQVHRW